MLQFYFLSVSLNALAGYFLFFRNDAEIPVSQTGFSLHNEAVKLIVGVLSGITGIIKLFSPIGGSLPVIGDLVPAITGILCGFILIFEFYKSRSTIDDSEHTEKINGVLFHNKKFIGALALIAAVLHFIFPRVPLI